MCAFKTCIWRFFFTLSIISAPHLVFPVRSLKTRRCRCHPSVPCPRHFSHLLCCNLSGWYWSGGDFGFFLSCRSRPQPREWLVRWSLAGSCYFLRCHRHDSGSKRVAGASQTESLGSNGRDCWLKIKQKLLRAIRSDLFKVQTDNRLFLDVFRQ